MKSPRDIATATARIRTDLIERAHREAGVRKASGDRDASVTSILSEWADIGSKKAPKSAA